MKHDEKKPKTAPRYAEEHDVGTLLCWPFPPNTRAGHEDVVAPTCRGVLSFIIAGWAVVRFERPGGRLTEPTVLTPGQPCTERRQP